MRSKVLIVGGGIMGTSIAIEAARRADPLRGPVVLLERKEIGAGSSGDSGAILRQHYSDRTVAAMARESLRAYASFEARSGRSIGFHKTGALTLAGPDQPEWVERIRSNVEMLTELGIRMEMVEGRRIRELFPGVTFRKGTVGAWEPDAGFVDPHRTLEAFAALARSYGAVTRLGVEVSDVMVEGGRATGVQTNDGEITADHVVVVAGPWSGPLLKRAGIEIPVRIVRPENLFFSMDHTEEAAQAPEEEGLLGFDMGEDHDDRVEGEDTPALFPTGLYPSLIDLEQGFYCRCEPKKRRIRVGRTDYDHDEVLDDPDELDPIVPDESWEWGRAALASRLPEFAESQNLDALASWYTLTPDAHGLIGPVPGIKGLHVVTGFSGHGFKLGPSVGLGIAQMLFDEPVTAFDPEFFSLERFQGGETWTGRFGL